MSNGDNIWTKISNDIDARRSVNESLPLESQLTQGIGSGINADFSSTENLTVGLPENNPDTGSLVDVATMGNFDPNGQNIPDTDVSFIQSQIDPLGGRPLALGDVTQEMFTPGISLPLAVGGTSGQLTGSRNIFVAQNQAVPFALLERRRAAQQQAAIKRAQDLERFKLRKPALSKDPRFNRNLVETANEFTDIFIDRATKQFGSREAAMAALTSPSTKIGREFAQQMDNLEILAGEVDQVVDLNAEVEKAIESGDQFVSDETLKLHNEFKNLSGKFLQGDAFGAASFRDKLTQLQTSQSLDQFMKDNDVLSSISGEIIQRAGIDDSRADQFRTTTRYTENFEEGARAQAKAMKQNVAFRNRQDLTEDDIFNRIMALKGKVDKRTASVKAKPKADGFTDKSQVPVSSEPKVVKVGDDQFQTENSTPYSQEVQNKPIIATGVISVDGDGNMNIRKGQTKFRAVENGVITTKDGVKRNVTFAKEIVNPLDLPKEEREKFGVRNSSGTLVYPKTVERDIVIDADNVSNTIKGQSISSKSTMEAFEDVSGTSKRQKQMIDQSNFDAYKQKFKESGKKSIREFNDFIKKEKGIDIIMNDELRSKLIETSVRK